MSKLKIGLLLCSTFFPSFLRLFVWRRLNFRVGVGCRVSPFTIVVADYIEIGAGAVIEPLTFIYRPKKFVMGERSRIASFVRIIGYGSGIFGPQTFVALGCLIDVRTEFHLGRRSGLGPRGTYYTHGDSGLICSKYYGMRLGPIIIGVDCWLGMACVVYPKVTIGDGTIVFPGLTITSDLPANKAAFPSNELYRLAPVRAVTMNVNDRDCRARMEMVFYACAEAYSGSSIDCSRADCWELYIPRRGRVFLMRDETPQLFNDKFERGAAVVWRMKRQGENFAVPTFEFSELVVSGAWTPFAEKIADFLVTKGGFHFVFEDRTINDANKKAIC